ncbi:hypothetical protein M406DRAFT_330801 [Cryphonectria parasitica EP155]|uniref:Uncharacterized protein n=1 Tax=Cryphonectria parasitica (strain ATCC 38755 / EP155) TaxID=660469 RepID=A0A9P4Y005_CRYP1|nr:uncharacterized protein M406DRAFT_330801 [Cryphonectria parasitica EP155]KAF3764467.1 hypothetical protein M406DRAFT_330801 [Cryphonectria parasitica EP155]
MAAGSSDARRRRGHDDVESGYGTVSPSPQPRTEEQDLPKHERRGPPEIRDFSVSNEDVGGEAEDDFYRLVDVSEVETAMQEVNKSVKEIYDLMKLNGWDQHCLNATRGRPDWKSQLTGANSIAVSSGGRRHVIPSEAYTLVQDLLRELESVRRKPENFASEDDQVREATWESIRKPLAGFTNGILDVIEEVEKVSKVSQKAFWKRVIYIMGSVGSLAMVLGVVRGSILASTMVLWTLEALEICRAVLYWIMIISVAYCTFKRDHPPVQFSNLSPVVPRVIKVKCIFTQRCVAEHDNVTLIQCVKNCVAQIVMSSQVI